jgi:hypothetical protein
MASNCETCGRLLPDPSERFCPPHQLKELRRLRKAGYLQPLRFRTLEGPVVLSRHKFLLLEEQAEKTSPCKRC